MYISCTGDLSQYYYKHAQVFLNKRVLSRVNISLPKNDRGI